MKYNLNLTKNYCSHWGVKEALRELIANTIDEGGTIEKVETPEDDFKLVLKTPGILTLEAFLMGYSVKQSDDCIGQYGEGLKLAVLVLLRESIPFSIIAGDTLYSFTFMEPEESLHTETLHVVTYKATEPVDGTVITVDGLIDYCNVVNSIYIDSPTGLLENKNALYCQGLLVETYWHIDFYGQENESYGLNLSSPLVANRDRNYIVNIASISKELEKYVEPEYFSSWWCTYNESNIIRNFSDEYKQKIAKAICIQSFGVAPELLEGKRIILLNSENSKKTYISDNDDYFVGPYYIYANAITTEEDSKVLKSLEVESDEEFVENCLNNDFDEIEEPIESYQDKRVRLINEFIDEHKEDTPLDNEIVSLLLGLMPMSRKNKQDISKKLEEIGIATHENLVLYNLYKD